MAAGRKQWWTSDAGPGALLALAALVSFLIVNSSAAHGFEDFLRTRLFAASIGPTAVKLDLHHFVNDGLMALFFLYVGLELKRESVEGPLRSPRAAALPVAAAIGGMAAPALIYLAFVQGAPGEYARGWAIPAATDIAFALGVLSLAGKHAPPGLRLFLLALAIVDDLGAILIIAVFYSTNLVGWALGGMVVTFSAMLVMNRSGVRDLRLYWVAALVLWGFTYLSGIHATIAGVLAALTVPMRTPEGHSPLINAEHALKPWVLLAIMPVFAIVNAGAPLAGLTLETLQHPVTVASALGLALGKPLGVAGVTMLAAGFMHRILPAPPLAVIGAACIAGVGFTMSLFIGTLAFGESEAAGPMRIGVIGGSILSALVGLGLIMLAARNAPGDPELAEQEHLAEDEGLLETR